MNYFRGIFLNNIFLKIISLIFAVTLWFYISPVISKDTIEINYTLPLQLRNIPENIMVSGKVDDHINVRFKGRQNAIKELNIGEVNVSVDLSNGREGTRLFTLTRSNVNNVPPNIDVVRIDPGIIKIDIVRIMRKSLAVKAVLKGTPARGYRVKSVSVNPHMVTLEGPEAELMNSPILESTAIDVTGRRKSFSKEVKINLPMRNVRVIGKDVVLIDVEVEKS